MRVINNTSEIQFKGECRAQQIEKLILSNGMHIVLIHDPETSQDGVALSIDVGSVNDPDDIPGMAHLVEHLLLNQEFKEFVNTHGGTMNGSTGMEKTIFGLEIPTTSFQEAFLQFFSIFNQNQFYLSSLNNEIQIIDEEYKHRGNNTHIKSIAVSTIIFNQDHPAAKNHTGNLKIFNNFTLDQLLNKTNDWYKNHYSANKMKLVILTRTSIQEMKTFIEKTFMTLPKRNVSIYNYNIPLFRSQQSSYLFYHPYSTARTARVNWIIKDNKDEAAGKMIANYLNRTIKGSLLNILLKNEYVFEIEVSNHIVFGFQFFSISLSLTQDGLKNLSNKIIPLCFRVISKIADVGIHDDFIQERYQFAKERMEYAPRGSPFDFTTCWAAELLRPQLDFNRFPYLIAASSKATSILAQQLFLGRLVIEIAAIPEELRSIFGIELKKKTIDYETSYADEEIPAETMSFWKKDNNTTWEMPEFKSNIFNVPIINCKTFLARKIDLKKDLTEIKLNEQFGKAYYLFNTQFTESIYSTLSVELFINQINSDPKYIIYSDLLFYLFEKTIGELRTEANEANCYFQIIFLPYSIKIHITAINTRVILLYKKLIEKISHISIDQSSVTEFLETVKWSLDNKNEISTDPLSLASDYLKTMMNKPTLSDKKFVQLVNQFDLKDFMEYVNTIFNLGYFVALFTGYFIEEAIQACIQTTTALFKKQMTAIHHNNYLKQKKFSLNSTFSTSKQYTLFKKYHYQALESQYAVLAIILQDNLLENTTRRITRNILDLYIKHHLAQNRQQFYAFHTEEIHTYLFDIFASAMMLVSTVKNCDTLASELQKIYLNAKTMNQQQFDRYRQALIANYSAHQDNFQSLTDTVFTWLTSNFRYPLNYVESTCELLKNFTYQEFQKITRELHQESFVILKLSNDITQYKSSDLTSLCQIKTLLFNESHMTYPGLLAQLVPISAITTQTISEALLRLNKEQSPALALAIGKQFLAWLESPLAQRKEHIDLFTIEKILEQFRDSVENNNIYQIQKN